MLKPSFLKQCSIWELQLEAIHIVFIVQDKTPIEDGKMQQKYTNSKLEKCKSFSLPPLVYYRKKARWLWPGHSEEERSSGSEAGHALSRACHAQMWEERGSKTVFNPLCVFVFITQKELWFLMSVPSFTFSTIGKVDSTMKGNGELYIKNFFVYLCQDFPLVDHATCCLIIQ